MDWAQVSVNVRPVQFIGVPVVEMDFLAWQARLAAFHAQERVAGAVGAIQQAIHGLGASYGLRHSAWISLGSIFSSRLNAPHELHLT